jgi:putative transposase
MRTSVSRYHRHRFPTEIISHCVWLYFRFAPSFCDVEEMLVMHGVSLSYETVRKWRLKFARRLELVLGEPWCQTQTFVLISTADF